MFLLSFLSSATVNVNACYGAYFKIEFDNSPNPNDNDENRSGSDYSDLHHPTLNDRNLHQSVCVHVARNITVSCSKRSFLLLERLKT